MFHSERETTRNTFRESVRGFLEVEKLSKIPMTGQDLQEFTTIKFYASYSFVNFASFSCVLGVTFCLGVMGWGRDIKDDYKSIHDNYQSLLTNVYWTNSAWIFVFLLEGIFVFYQLAFYHSMPLVESSIAYWFFAVNCAQLGWVISYCFDIVWLSALFLAVGIVFLSILNANIYKRDYVNGPVKEGTSPQDREIPEELRELNIVMEFIIFRMPFQVHLGWAVFTLFVNVNEVWAAFDLPSPGIIAIVSIVSMWTFGICILFIPRYPLFIAPLMIAWGAIGIWVELTNPRFDIRRNYERSEVLRMKGAAIATCIEHILLPILRFALHFAATYNLLERDAEENLPGI